MHGKKYNQNQQANIKLGGKKTWTYITDISLISLIYKEFLEVNGKRQSNKK